MEQESLLNDLEFNPVPASVGKRFLNYVVDVIIYYILSFLYGLILTVTGRTDIATDDDKKWLLLLSLMLIVFLYYSLSESVLKGRTIGKIVTGTKVVNEDGSEPTAKTYLLRTLCRFLPFEPLSTFGGRPWHDKWTRTYVIDIKKTELNNASL